MLRRLILLLGVAQLLTVLLFEVGLAPIEWTTYALIGILACLAAMELQERVFSRPLR